MSFYTPFAFIQSAAAPAATLLLDDYPNALRAYSVRKLRNAYTGFCLKVRRSSDNTTQDIGFDSNGDLDTAAITSFVGANDGFVDTWYDQSGNGVNAVQATAGSQPQIVSSGTIQTTGTKTSILALNKFMTFTSATVTRHTQLLVGKKNSATSNRLIAFGPKVGEGANPVLAHWNDSQIYFQWEDYYTQLNSNIANINYEVIIASTTSATTATTARKGSTLATSVVALGSIGTTISQIMQYLDATAGRGDAQYQELVVWDSEQDSNFTGIQNDVNAYYSIY
jgi:hypothetical protein